MFTSFFNKAFFQSQQGYYLGIGLNVVLLLLLLSTISSIWSKIAIPPVPAISLPSLTTTSSTVNLIPSWHLFGSPQETAALAAHLNLTVTGLFFSTDSKKAAAIISAPNQPDKLYHPGATLPGGAILQQITPQGILLLDNGQVETLLLPKPLLRPFGNSTLSSINP